MCGICGRFSDEPVDEGWLLGMTRRLAHRGPDDEGMFVRENVGLGHRRLSIIDLDGGSQPMSNADGSVWIVYNGEIYNYQGLRDRLIRDGCRFRTKSDTETILHLYEQHGTQCLQYLRGMFAFAIWDERRRRIFAARDRLGQKPLYYVQRGNELIFASEIKALLAADPGLARLDLAGLDEYLTLRLISPPRSMFAEIRKLPPAHYLTFDQESGMRVERYWNLAYEPKLAGSEEELLDELEERLVECIRFHLVSDVPVGAFMSGGLDSTLVVALLMKHGLADDFMTFSVGLPYREFDEAPAARLVAERYQTRHHEEQINPSLLKSLPRLAAQLDEPSDPLSVCMDLIAGMARKHVKVVLGGDGGDELFGGYDRYYGNRLSDYYAMIPAPLRRHLMQPALGLVPDGNWYKSPGHQLKWMHRLSFFEGGERYVQSLGYFYIDRDLKDELYGPVMREAEAPFDPGQLMRRAYDRAAAEDPIDRMLYADCQSRLPDHPMMIQDRMTMAHGLEARSPYMDHEIAEFAARLPVEYKVRGRTLRYLQVQLAKRYLPPELLTRKKQGFSSALPYMLKDELNLLYDVFLRDPELAREGILEQGPIGALLDEHRAGKADHGSRLWLLVNSEVWYRLFTLGQTEGHLAESIAAVTGEQARA
ncbi:MAG: asparagine synthase (glutamine-hydrolyzing) [Planctomycetota bacterium]|jgi:asparagine synthase (glutamine-hydrolysing)